MSYGRDSIVDEGVTITGFTLDMTDYLQDCFDKLEAGQEDLIMADPFYTPRGGPFSDEKVDRLIAALDEEYGKEIDNFRDHHAGRSGANTKPEWHRLGPRARRALAEGCMRIIEEWNPVKAEVPDPVPRSAASYAADRLAEGEVE